MNLRKRYVKTIVASLFIASALFASDAQIQQKMSTLQKSIDDATAKGIDVEREKMTLQVAEAFKTFIKWDTENIALQEEAYASIPYYKEDSKKLAQELPDFERTKVIEILDKAISTLAEVKAGKIVRPKTNEPDFKLFKVNQDRLEQEGKTIFAYDYVWKPRTPELQKYFGAKKDTVLCPSLLSEDKTVDPSIIEKIEKSKDDSVGSIFLGHTLPKWAEDIENIKHGERLFVRYDIDNPQVREMWQALAKQVVPAIAGGKISELGYSLSNEPHWFTAKDVWATGEVSDFTKENFKKYLKKTHRTIATVNKLWGTDFKSFDVLEIEIPMDKELQGTPIWYDWLTFNTVRVTEWFTFLKKELKKYDSNAKTHIKVMPNLWTNNARDHGLDMEALIEITDIIGHDAGSHISLMKEVPSFPHLDEKYSFDWREMCMSADFFMSVAPEKLMINSETHFFSTVHFREMDLSDNYCRLTLFLSAITGTDVHNIWYWGRNADGSIKKTTPDFFPASICQQPNVLNAIELTEMDLNSVGDIVHQFQEQQRPIRIFYSKTSAINDPEYMDKIFALYEKLYFEGINIGFATENILKKIKPSTSPILLVAGTETVTSKEIMALKKYLGSAGIIISDKTSLKLDQYNKKHRGTMLSKLYFEYDSIDEIAENAINKLAELEKLPILEVNQSNDFGTNLCMWRTYKTEEGKIYLAVSNLANGDNTISVRLRDSSESIKLKDVFTGKIAPATLKLGKFASYLLEVTK